MSANGRLGEVEYAELVGRVRAAASSSLPPGATVLVVSKGDAGLLELPGVSTAHFPQDEAGAYAGHHPKDSAAATAQLEALRWQGAEYLLIPETARWWLDFYDGFAAHLLAHGELIADVQDACLIYSLGRGMAMGRVPGVPEKPRASISQVRDFLQNLISADARLAVVEAEGGVASALAPIDAATLGVEELEIDPLSGLRRAVRQGARYLVVPRNADAWLDEHRTVAALIENRCRKVADQRHLCRVFELDGLEERA
jgi:hypothetical protein